MSATRDWDAALYDRVSDPQVEWARDLIERAELRGDEAVLDAGCGTGRVTAMLLERLPRGRVVAVDSSPSMLEQARENLPPEVEVSSADLAALRLDEPVDVVFSSAVLHWIPDDAGVFGSLHAALRPGGRLVAQCGGDGNIARFLERLGELAGRDPYAPHLRGWTAPWRFRSPRAGRRALEQAGFVEVEAWLEPRRVAIPDPRDFMRASGMTDYLARLPEERRDGFLDELVSGLGDPPVLEYVRLNLDARRPT